ncbi:hypothetical protein [Bradyrhizobium sp.]|uniref:hypothetical protein n=1 Tax=Bradyrhizobium sp. TaxID=376 RepID=UPI0039E3DB02
MMLPVNDEIDARPESRITDSDGALTGQETTLRRSLLVERISPVRMMQIKIGCP